MNRGSQTATYQTTCTNQATLPHGSKSRGTQIHLNRNTRRVLSVSRAIDITNNIAQSTYYGYQGIQNQNAFQVGLAGFGFAVNGYAAYRGMAGRFGRNSRTTSFFDSHQLPMVSNPVCFTAGHEVLVDTELSGMLLVEPALAGITDTQAMPAWVRSLILAAGGIAAISFALKTEREEVQTLVRKKQIGGLFPELNQLTNWDVK